MIDPLVFWIAITLVWMLGSFRLTEACLSLGRPTLGILSRRTSCQSTESNPMPELLDAKVHARSMSKIGHEEHLISQTGCLPCVESLAGRPGVNEPRHARGVGVGAQPQPHFVGVRWKTAQDRMKLTHRLCEWKNCRAVQAFLMNMGDPYTACRLTGFPNQEGGGEVWKA